MSPVIALHHCSLPLIRPSSKITVQVGFKVSDSLQSETVRCLEQRLKRSYRVNEAEYRIISILKIHS